MSVRIELVHTTKQKLEIYRFRYRVYVEQLHMIEQADHGRRLLSDPLDADAVNFGVYDGDEVVGSVRLLYLDEVRDPKPLVTKFHMQPAIETFGLAGLCTTSRFILDPRIRNGKTTYHLMRAAFTHAVEHGARIVYGDCSPNLLAFYERMGYRRYCAGLNDPLYGYKYPIMMFRDWPHLQRCRSPFARLRNCYPNDTQACEWYGRTYPYRHFEHSTATLSHKQFLQLIAQALGDDPSQKLALLRGLDHRKLGQILRDAALVTLQPGDELLRLGEHLSGAYVLLSGRLIASGENAPPDFIYRRADIIPPAQLNSGRAIVALRADTHCRVLVLPRYCCSTANDGTTIYSDPPLPSGSDDGDRIQQISIATSSIHTHHGGLNASHETTL